MMTYAKLTITIKSKYELSDKEYDALSDDIETAIDPVLIQNMFSEALNALTDHALIVEVT